MEPVTLWACTDCYFAAVNDDYSGIEGAEREQEVRAAIERVGDITPGLDYSQHADDCDVTRDYLEGVAGESECECEHVTFSWTPCDICLSHLGGSRHAFTIWPTH